jgi:hypothetical protein
MPATRLTVCGEDLGPPGLIVESIEVSVLEQLQVDEPWGRAR